MLKVATYNILSEKFVNHSRVDKKYLSSPFRYPLILKELEDMIKDEYIIALQEVTYSIFEDIKILLSKYDYQYRYSFYGKGKIPYGVAILLPQKYKIVSSYSERIADIIKYQNNVIVKQAKKYQHKALFVSIIENKKVIDICTYHMPCAFMTPDVIALHLYYLYKIMSANENILLGDFNIQPYSQLYQFLTNNLIYNKLRIEPFVDVSKEYNKAYLKTTRTLGTNGEFYSTLDYIFYNKGFKIIEVIQEKDIPIIPDLTHGSDHVPVKAILEVL